MKILVFGSSGLVGSSITRSLKRAGYEVIPSNREDTNLFNFAETKDKILKENPNIVINAAAKVGGIFANNTLRTEFILENLKINMNILESSIGVKDIKIINLGSSCIYPLNAINPITEDSIMTGPLEPTNSPYAMAKLTAIEIGDSLRKQYGMDIVNLMPTNLYGPNDNFTKEHSHVIPGLIARMHEAKIKNEKEFYIWGSGKPLREFLFVDDLSDCINFIIDNDIQESLINVGSGQEISILELAKKIKEIVKYDGNLFFDSSKPDGNPRKLLNSSLINDLGWKPKTSLKKGLSNTYEWYLSNIN